MESPPDGSPGPDGFPMRFFQHFWDITTTDLHNAVLFFRHGNKRLHLINISWLFLV